MALSETIAFDPLASGGAARRNRTMVVVYGLLALFAAYYLLPLGVIVLNSFRNLDEIARGGLIGLPHSFSTQYWATAWSTFCVNAFCKGISPFFFNSLWMTIPATISGSPGPNRASATAIWGVKTTAAGASKSKRWEDRRREGNRRRASSQNS